MFVTEIPNLNSEQFVKWPSEQGNSYHSVPFGTDLFQRTIPIFQRNNIFYDTSCPKYFQLKQFDQKFSWQIAVSEYSNMSFEWRKFDGTVIPATIVDFQYATLSGDTYDANGEITPIQLYRKQFTFLPSEDLTDEGYYFLVGILEYDTNPSNDEVFISEPYWIKETHEQTVLIEYNHSANDYDVMWSLSPYFNIRVPAYLDYTTNKVERTVFRNQNTNLRQLYARDWRVYTLKVGYTISPYGITPYHCDKIAKIQKCDYIYLDGVRYIMESETDFEPQVISEAYPLRTLQIQFAEYYSEQSIAAIKQGTIILIETDSYPFAVNSFAFFRVSGSGAPAVNFLYPYAPDEGKVILNSTELDDFIDDLNAYAAANGMTGTFFRDAINIKYTFGEGELYTTIIQACTYCLIIQYQKGTDPSDLTVTFNSPYSFVNVIIAPDGATGNVRSYGLPDSGVAKNIPTTGSPFTSGTCYLFSNGGVTGWAINGDFTEKCIQSISGSVSPLLQGIDIRNYTLLSTTLNLSFLNNAAQSLQGVNIIGGNIDTLASAFPVSVTGDWQQLAFVGFSYNSLDATAQDNFYNNFHDSVFVAGYGTIFTLDTRLQTPTSSPTAASATKRSNMTSAGNTILF